MSLSVVFAMIASSIVAGSATGGADTVGVAADTLGRFPSVEGSNLEGERFTLPTSFKSPLNVVLVAFKREQQGDVDTWMPFLRTLRENRRDLSVYELPTLGRRYRVMRSFIDGGMRRGIPDSTVRAATITL